MDAESQLVLLSDAHTWVECVSFLDHNHVAYAQIITVQPIKSQSNSHGQWVFGSARTAELWVKKGLRNHLCYSSLFSSLLLDNPF